ncbi:MDM2 protein [Gryllus bimaculatus]|nr:MDM2 protein [Gryllus bimaculatus]
MMQRGEPERFAQRPTDTYAGVSKKTRLSSHSQITRLDTDMLYTATAKTMSKAVHPREDRDFWADSSSSNLDSDSDSDETEPVADKWECVRCKVKSIPLATYCLRCFQLRKSYFPERPKRKHPHLRKRSASSPPGPSLADAPSNVLDLEQAQSSGSQTAGKLEKGDNGVSNKQLAHECPSTSQSSSLMLQVEGQDSAPPDEPDRELLSPKSELCPMCVDRPKDGAVIHSKTVHILYCYQCALKAWNKTKKCPMCNNRPHDVLKLIFG